MRNEYKRRQLIMKMAGYNVPQDGSWGPYQQLIWNKINTREKEYKPTVWGLLLKGYDTITGNTTYKVPEATILATSGDPDRSRKTKALRNADYWHPIWGAGLRWKTSMSNDTNPFVGIGRTIVPAVAGAAIAEYAPAVVARAATAVPHIVRTVAAHPHLSAQVAKTAAVNTGKAFVKGMIGGKAVDMTSQNFTGHTWGENLAPYIGTSAETADWLNPGYLLGGKSWGFTKRFKDIKNAKYNFGKAEKAQEEARIAYERKKSLYDAENDKLQLLKEDEASAQEAFYDAQTKLRDTREVVKSLSPLQHKFKVLHAKRNHKYRQAVASDEAPLEGSLVEYEIRNFPFAINTTSTKTSKIGFKAPQVNVESEIHYTLPSGLDLGDTRIFMPYNPEGLRIGMVKGRTNGRFGTVIEGDTKSLQEGIGKYIDDLHGVMGEEGTVAGSLVHYRNGVLKGTQHGEEFIGPADTEIYTTAERYPRLVEKLQFKETANNSTGGHKGTSPYTFRNTDSAHNGLDTEINIIEADENGMARGKIAHQIYRSLWPERYSKISYDHTMSGNVTPTSDISLPITAEELLQTLRRDPEAMLTHLLTDLVGMETFTNPKHTKATKRLYSMLFDTDPGTTSRLDKALRIHGKYNMGSQFKLGTELYPNLSFNDIEANKAFLKKVYQITDEEAEKLASNPEVMKNAFNLYNFSMSTNTRMVGNDVITDEVAGQRWHNPQIELFTGNGAFSGGTASGAGLNTTLLNPYGGWHTGKSRGGKPMNVVGIAQRPLTYRPENIQTPMDLVNLVERLAKATNQPYYALELATFNTEKPIEYNMEEMEKIFRLSEANDEPVLLGMNGYGFAYSGGIAKPIAAGARTVSERDAPELGSLLRDIKMADKTETTLVKEDSPRYILKYLTDIEHGGKRYLDLFKSDWAKASPAERGKFLKEERLYQKGKYSLSLDLGYVPMKRDPYSYNVFDVGVNGVTYNAHNINETMSRVNREYNQILKNGYTPDEQYMATYRENLAGLSKQWRELMKYYKAARKNLFRDNQEVEKAGAAYQRALRTTSRLYDAMEKALKESKEYSKAYSQSMTDTHLAKVGIENAKDKLKEHFQAWGIGSGVGLLTIGAPYLLREEGKKRRRYAAMEQAGEMNPANGWYESELYDEEDEANDSTWNIIDEKVKIAKDKYKSKHKRTK